ncbi:MAG: HNH endonuclease [Clostridia bacterium]|nr:HNH endonuclease [Clostridia bacterium]
MCGKSIYEGALINIDHIVPRSLGGTDDLDNLQTLCVECHNIKENSII